MKPLNKILLSACLLILSPVMGWSENIRADILQIKLNRLYFSVGEEVNVFANCRFVILQNNDKLLDGYIEASYPGVSYSYSLNNIFDSINIDSCFAWISPAEKDSLSPINIGILKTIPFGHLSNYPGITAYTRSDDSLNSGIGMYGNILHTVIYDSDAEMRIDFEAGLLDACFSYNKILPYGAATTSIHAPAPFFAAVIPNIFSEVYERSLLTTSIYYRFNEEQLPSLFDGDEARPFNCLYPKSVSCTRMYEYDSNKGRNLLNYFKKRPKRIRISIDNESLGNIGQYFADILSRDKIRVTLTENLPDADIYLQMVPLRSDPLDTSFIYIRFLLESGIGPEKTNLNILDNINQYLKSYRDTSGTFDKTYYPDLIQRNLIEDIGVFPLFRPTLYFICNNGLKGASFDKNGRLDLKNLRKIILPERIQEPGP